MRKECDGNGYAPSAVAAAPLRKIDIALQPLLTSLADEAQEIRAFGLGTATANQNDQPQMRSFCSELQKVVAVASDHHTLIVLCGRKNGFIRSGAREKISEPDNVVFVPLQSVLDRGRHVVVEGEISLHAFVDLWQRQSLDFSLMIFVVSEALEDLRPAQIRKRGANAVHIPTKKKVGNDIVYTDSCAFDPRVSAADSLSLHDVAIVRCGFHPANYITTFRKIDIAFGWKRLFPRVAEPNTRADVPQTSVLSGRSVVNSYFGAREATLHARRKDFKLSSSSIFLQRCLRRPGERFDAADA